MSSSLPSTQPLKLINDYGMGTYDRSDSSVDNEESSGESLPGVQPNSGYEQYTSYDTASTNQFSMILNQHLASFILGFNDSLPSDSNNPSSRSDYYDNMTMGNMMDNAFPTGDAGAYVSNTNLPGPGSNESKLDNTLGAFGNSESGYVIEDQQVPYGFPSEDYSQSDDFQRSNDNSMGGNILSSTRCSMEKVSTNINLSRDLTKKFLKSHGKINITKRTIIAFLESEGYGSQRHLSSDIVRCLKHDHNIVIPDVLDIFPIKTASNKNKLSNVASYLLNISNSSYSTDISTSHTLKKCASNVLEVIRILDQEKETR